MPAVATEKWSNIGGTLDAEINGNTFNRAFDVVGAADGFGAVSAVRSAFNINYNSSHLNMEALKLKTFQPRTVGLGVHEVTAVYSVPPNGSWQTPEDDADPLDAPAEISWSPNIVSEPFDRDIDGNPVLNSAGDAPANPPSRTYVYSTLTITTNEEFYNYAGYKPYINTVNSDSIEVDQPNSTTVTFAAGTVKCVSIAPARMYKATDSYVPITRTFEIWDLAEISTTQPHQCRILDQGSSGWYNDEGVKNGSLCTDQGEYVANDKLLDGTGKPLDSTLKVRDGGEQYTPVARPGGTPTGATIEGTADAKYLLYKRYKAKAFAGVII
ncbi:MAG TPA: hypothetical protein VGN72_00185 [Tepidisphaeraceae bacterium]|jgi:hypothetical protein|nr:hypothetical protein [Tepidisphaeraceae bacterium]